jgi:hypothetical protein
MKYPPAPLTPFPASRPQNWRVFLPQCASPLTGCPRRNPSVFCSRLFSRTYELPPPPYRFASHALSCTYELLFPQLACFQKHLRCPLVFSSTSEFPMAPVRKNGSRTREGLARQSKVSRAPAAPLSTFRMNTCKSVSKQRTLSPFRMNTYAKTGGRGVLLLT